MTAELPDPSASAAVLIGTADYLHLAQLPAVRSNLADLATVLQDATIWGLPQAHTFTVADPGTPAEFLDPVYAAGERARDTLFVYYCGHGLRDSESADLYVALTGSREGAGYTAVEYRHLRSAILASPAQRKIVVLDCCFSGRAARTLGGPGALAAQAGMQGVYVLTASPKDHVALAPDGERHTAFTGELLDVLRRGLPDAPDTLDLETLYRAVDARLGSKNRPRPQRSQENDVGRLPLVRNRARASGGTPAGPVIDAEVEGAMISAGLQLSRLLRSVGRSRDALPILRMILQSKVPGATGDAVVVHLELADLLTESGQDTQAIDILEQAFHITRKRFGPEAVTVCRRLAALLQSAGNHSQACEVLLHALDMLERASGPAAQPRKPPEPDGSGGLLGGA
ncbi:caspase family protein [Streptomyces sp. ASQP_92]|uniref:caspase family protein n=1 Tax=Streptomyces sp. ASQP_92 TaxID=2979116 RepID=UPI0021C10CFE|nr:caspase family protein [Streptomyces sp. ASQP_92]MCT9092096.1 caspase family protein [Streptomyces sp. ASQP_92]